MISISVYLPSYVYVLIRFFNKSFLGRRFYLTYSRYDHTLALGCLPNFARHHAKKLLNIGSGGFSLPDCISLDLQANNRSYALIQGKPFIDYFPVDLNVQSTYIDLLEKIDYDFVYCSHTFEHLERAAMLKVIHDVLDNMSTDGVFRLVLPSYDKWYSYAKLVRKHCPYKANFLNKLKQVFYAPSVLLPESLVLNLLDESSTAPEFYSRLKSLADNANNAKPHLGPEAHLQMVSYIELQSIVENAGCQIFRLGPNVSSARIFQMKSHFDNTERDISDYYEIIKK